MTLTTVRDNFKEKYKTKLKKKLPYDFIHSHIQSEQGLNLVLCIDKSCQKTIIARLQALSMKMFATSIRVTLS